MARLNTFGFESGSLQSEGLTTQAGAFTWDTSNGRPAYSSGPNLGTCLAVTPDGTQQYVRRGSLSQNTDYYIRVYVKKSANPSIATKIITGYDGTVDPFDLQFLTDGTLNLRDSVNASLYTSSALNNAQWYRIELHVKTATSTTGTIELAIDGTIVYTSTTANLGAAATWSLYIGNPGAVTSAGSTFYFDDCAVNDTTGNDENAWPGVGKVYLLPPASDPGTSSANWTKPGGGTTNRNTSVDNVPPVYETYDGTSASAEDYLRNVTSSANDALLLTCQSYQAAGVSGRIKFIQPVCVTGSDSATDTAGDIGISSNPTIAQLAFTTFDNGIASATATTWPLNAGTILYNPTGVDSNTGPVIQVRKVTATTRAAIVNAAFVLVESVPVSTPARWSYSKFPKPS